MSVVKVSQDLLTAVRERLVKTAALEKTAQQLRSENDVLHRTMSLVAAGQLDAAVALDKIATFIADPDQLRVFEAALGLSGGDATKIGSAVDADPGDDVSGDGTPEEKYQRRLRNILSDGA